MVPLSSEAPAPPRRIVAILLTIIPLSQIPLDVYTPALPRMVLDLHAASTTVQNTVTTYMLGMSLAFIPIGVAADAWGRKHVVLACLSVVVLTSIGCAVAPDIGVLLALRFVQGAAARACMVVTYAIAADCFSGKRLTSVSGVLGAAWGVAPVLAPGGGGLLVQFISWRAIFVLIAGLAGCVAAIVTFALPETLALAARSPLEARSAARTAFGALRNRSFVCFVLVFGVMAAAQLTFGVVSPFLYQDGLAFTPAAYGAIALVVGFVNLIGGMISAGCYFIVSIVMAVAGVLPENSQAPLGWLYMACGVAAFLLLGWATLSRRSLARQ